MKKSLVGINPRIGGSVALKHWLGDKYWNQSPPKDIDWFGYSLDNHLKSSLEVTPNFLHTNVSTREEFFSVDLCEPLRVLLKRNQDDTYLDLKTLLIIKNAHKHFYRGKYSKSFKHLIDYSNLKALIPLTEEDEALSEQYRLWMIEWVYYNDKRLIRVPSLNKSKDAFFTDGVTYYVDHDYIHERVKIKDKPAYTLCLTGEVMFSTSIFDSLPYDSFEIELDCIKLEDFELPIKDFLKEYSDDYHLYTEEMFPLIEERILEDWYFKFMKMHLQLLKIEKTILKSELDPEISKNLIELLRQSFRSLENYYETSYY